MTWIFWTILVPIVIVSVLILIHELGHFLVAKWCGVGIVRFAIGFGPALFKRRIGDVEYRIGLIPLGGYVRMVGDISDIISGPDTAPSEEGGPVKDVPPELLADRSKWFMEKGVAARSAIVFAGPLFNLVSAFFFIALAIFCYGDESLEESALIGKIGAGSPAEQAGLKSGDLVRKLDGVAITKWEELADRMHHGTGAPVQVTIARKGPDKVVEEIELTVTPQKKKLPPTGKEVLLIGVSPHINHRDVGALESLTLAGKWVYFTTAGTLEGLIGMFIGKVSPKELAGPLFIFDVASEQAQRGFEYVLSFMAHLSVSLAVLNLLPIPILDGGHLLFFLLEAILGPVSMRKREIASQIGLAFLLLLMGVALTNDFRRASEPKQKPEIEWNSDSKQSQEVVKPPEAPQPQPN